MDFVKEVLGVITGNLPVPETDPPVFIKNRSVCRKDDRKICLNYLENVVRKLGYDDVVQQSWENDGITYQNLVTTIEGSDPELKKEYIVIGGHYDVQNSESHCWSGTRSEGFVVTQGADDNGSGAVACIDYLRRFKEKNIVFTRTVKVVLFDGEEPGYHVDIIGAGSKYFTDQLKEPINSIKLAFIIDMLGGPLTNERVGYVLCSNSVKDNLLRDTISTHLPDELVTIGSSKNTKTKKYNYSNLSDSKHFLKYEIPTILFTNIGGMDTMPYFYHTEKDSIDIIDWQSFVKGIDIGEKLLINNEWYN